MGSCIRPLVAFDHWIVTFTQLGGLTARRAPPGLPALGPPARVCISPVTRIFFPVFPLSQNILKIWISCPDLDISTVALFCTHLASLGGILNTSSTLSIGNMALSLVIALYSTALDPRGVRLNNQEYIDRPSSVGGSPRQDSQMALL